ncbi:DUF1993 family protein [uncultured Tateyamaria sp.]|uniref:DUF1993 family protein n=1 Tax=uncultured Tateyamaria sp. TaxID=455651 RepID=UPI0026112152|nr:DUF1993 family protein [uncultured Tateyamaria sp.]
MDLYDATIPPLKRLTDAVQRLLSCLDDPAQLDARLAPDGFTAAEHFCVALGYVARTVMPLRGDKAPDMPMDTDPGAILALAQDMRFLLDQLDRTALDGADTRQIVHTAGEAELTQSGRDYALLYALPNAQFHLTLAYATVRMAGARVGKGDLDGFHIYSPGTSFVSDTPLN